MQSTCCAMEITALIFIIWKYSTVPARFFNTLFDWGRWKGCTLLQLGELQPHYCKRRGRVNCRLAIYLQLCSWLLPDPNAVFWGLDPARVKQLLKFHWFQGGKVKPVPSTHSRQCLLVPIGWWALRRTILKFVSIETIWKHTSKALPS